MLVACGKRPVDIETIREAAARIERNLFQDFEDEVNSSFIGEQIMTQLRAIDSVAYVRFASVYKKFETAQDFSEIVAECQADEREALNI